jgi:diacylglycerol kinase (ATP)
MVGCGLPAVVNHYAGKLRILKSQRYNAGAIWAIVRHKSMCMEVDVPGLDDIIVSDFVLGSNTVHVGTGLKAAPAALTDDGLLDLFILKPGGRASTARIFSELLRGTHLANPRVVCMQVSEFSVASKEEAQLNIDGENYRFSRLNVSVLPEEIDFLL